ncbi:class I SAM-dependent methyltransferase [Kribbella sp. NPDC050241]|uniref:class I SAM-dependent methyltransferase n=1 Tax=Kribbella sp. NPDC050241 TaxID=3364115 RepID=UPI00378F71B4
MTITLPEFDQLEDSLWLTLCGRALDNRRDHPLLGDERADEIVRAVDYDYRKLKIASSSAIYIAHRALKLDQVAQDFITRHPDAIGLDLGAGLDSRASRLDLPSTVDWYDVDFPDVVTARQQLIPAQERVHNLAADISDPGWLDAVASDRPAVVVADGLLAFFPLAEWSAILGRIIDHFPSGEIAFNAYSTFAVKAAKIYPGAKAVRAIMRSEGFDDPRTPESWNPKLKLVKEILLTREPEVAQFPAGLRWANRLSAHSESLSRRGNVVLRYRF